jgi:hypothetical protein
MATQSHMVRHQAEAIEGNLALAEVRRQMVQVLSVIIVVEDTVPVIPSYNDMREFPKVFNSRFWRHKVVFYR